MSILLSKIWGWCKRTIFTAKWWKNHWYLPFAFLGFVLFWAMGGKSPVIKLNEKINNLKEKEREDVKKIKKSSKAKEKDIEKNLKEDKDKVKKETEKNIDDLKERIKEDNKKIKGDSEKINDALNDILGE